MRTLSRPVLTRLKDLWQYEECRSLQLLHNALRDGRFERPLILAGPYGTGKTTIAQQIAYRLGCTNLVAGYGLGCGKCDMCSYALKHHLQIQENFVHINCRQHDRAREVIHALHEFGSGSTIWASAKGKPDGVRVYCLDEAHALSKERQEELQDILDQRRRWLFVFATTELEALNGLIRGRSWVTRVPTPSHDVCVQKLQEIARSNNIAITSEAVAEIVRLSSCRPRECIDYLAKYSYLGGEITASSIQQVEKS